LRRKRRKKIGIVKWAVKEGVVVCYFLSPKAIIRSKYLVSSWTPRFCPAPEVSMPAG